LNIFEFDPQRASVNSSNLSLEEVATNAHNILRGKATALLATWLDSAKQTSEDDLLRRYKEVLQMCPKWEKSHYLLGHYYNRVLEHEQSKPNNRQRESYLSGDLIRSVCISYLRSLHFGSKYLYETLPKVFTLWLDFGAHIYQFGSTKEDKTKILQLRAQKLTNINEHVEKSLRKLPIYLVIVTSAVLTVVFTCVGPDSLANNPSQRGSLYCPF
jgi:serine/threonine-protein kinase ATR